ncbi:MAG: hypothetical protein KC417_10885, partial [Myxococcales bacterium]|nr:hypothetical protein [Myxococcales bacterium]
MGEFRRDSTGSPLRERKSGVLSDAYVHFLRWGAEKVRRAPGGGVLAFVTNASYLDGPVHRGIRGALLEWFDDLRVVDLGGSALVARRGVVDENLFGVRPAAAVLVAVTRGGGLRGSDVSRDVTRGSRVGFTRLDGTRQQKLAAMAGPLESEPVFPAGPGFLFRPMPSVPAAYGRWPSLPELMPFHAEGVQTNRDEVVVAQSREELVERVRRFAFGSNDDDLHAACARLPHYDPDRARAALRDAMSADPDGIGDGWVRPLAWRPFDTRWFVPVAPFCHRPRPKLLRAIDGRTPMLLTVRKDRGERPWSHAAASTVIPDNCFLSSRSSCRTRAFPCRTPSGTPNLDREALTRSWPPAVAARVEPASLVAFALAVLSAPAYRQLGDAFLHVDYPRIPPPPDLETFDAVVAAGRAIAHALTMPDGEPGMPPPDPWRALGHTGRVTDSWLRAVDAANDVVQPWLPSF